MNRKVIFLKLLLFSITFLLGSSIYAQDAFFYKKNDDVRDSDGVFDTQSRLSPAGLNFNGFNSDESGFNFTGFELCDEDAPLGSGLLLLSGFALLKLKTKGKKKKE